MEADSAHPAGAQSAQRHTELVQLVPSLIVFPYPAVAQSAQHHTREILVGAPGAFIGQVTSHSQCEVNLKFELGNGRQATMQNALSRNRDMTTRFNEVDIDS